MLTFWSSGARPVSPLRSASDLLCAWGQTSLHKIGGAGPGPQAAVRIPGPCGLLGSLVQAQLPEGDSRDMP